MPTNRTLHINQKSPNTTKRAELYQASSPREGARTAVAWPEPPPAGQPRLLGGHPRLALAARASTSSTTSSTVLVVVSTTTASGATESGAYSPGRVDVVTAGDVGGHLVVVHVEQLLAATLSTLLVAGGHVDLYRGFREDDRPDVTSLDHSRSPRLRPIPAGGGRAPTHLGVGGHHAHGPGHFGAAHLDGGVHPVDQHASATSRCMSTASLATTGGSSGSTPRRMAMKATARYMAPVSR